MRNPGMRKKVLRQHRRPDKGGRMGDSDMMGAGHGEYTEPLACCILQDIMQDSHTVAFPSVWRGETEE